MSTPDRATLDQALAGCRVDAFDAPLSEIAAIGAFSATPGVVALELVFGVPVQGVRDAITATVTAAITRAVPGVRVDLSIGWQIAANAGRPGAMGMAGVRNLIAVASGKGGVGKSTTAVNLALALARDGARVGLLDADVYGPSQQMMLGVPESQRPESPDNHSINPIVAHGLQTMSLGYLVEEKTAMVWRGPMAGQALQQMLTQTRWTDLDYLIVDMPPGTGDIQLTLSQKAPVSAAVIVTTPQDIALLDCKKGIEMFSKVNIPVLGVVENMAVHVCSKCGHAEHIFGVGGGARIAREYGVPLLGALPLDIRIREQADGGAPTVAAEPEGTLAQGYIAIARRMAVQLVRQNRRAQAAFPHITITND